MNKRILATITILPLALAACGKPETITAGAPDDPTANQVKEAPPVKLPPALLASKTFRCKDNSLVYVDFFNDNQTATLKTSKTGEPTPLAASAAGQPFEGGGYTLTGTGNDKVVTIKKPGGAGQSCTA